MLPGYCNLCADLQVTMGLRARIRVHVVNAVQGVAPFKVTHDDAECFNDIVGLLFGGWFVDHDGGVVDE